MVGGLAELAPELVCGVVEGALDWLETDQKHETDEPHGSRYVTSLYEERRPPPGSQQDQSR